jgi:hypothetical protein
VERAVHAGQREHAVSADHVTIELIAENTWQGRCQMGQVFSEIVIHNAAFSEQL